MASSCVVNGSFLLMLMLSHICGLAPVSFKRVRDGFRIELLKSPYYKYIFLAFIDGVHFISTCLYLVWPTITGEIHVVSFVLQFLHYIELSTFINNAILCGKIRLESLVECVPINKQMNVAREIGRCLIIAYFVFLRTGCTLCPIFFSANKLGSTLKFFLGFFVQFIQALIELSMSLIKFEFQKYMETIKLELMKITADIKSDKKTKPAMSDISISLRALSKAFVSTCDNFFKYSATENLLAVNLSTMFTANLIRTIYNFAAACTSKDNEYKAQQSSLEMAFLVLHVSRIILFVEASSEIGKEVDNIRYQIAQVSELVTQVGKKIPYEAEIFQVVVLANYPKLMPMGLFSVTRNLLAPILSTVATYAIVMVQIDSL